MDRAYRGRDAPTNATLPFASVQNEHLYNEDGCEVDGEEDGDGGNEVADGEEVEPDGQYAGENLEQEREVDEEGVGHLLGVAADEMMGFEINLCMLFCISSMWIRAMYRAGH